MARTSPGGTSAPDCPNRLVGPVSGVMVVGEKDVAAYVAGAIGINSFLVRTRATAVAGHAELLRCERGPVLRAAAGCVPVSINRCDGQQP